MKQLLEWLLARRYAVIVTAVIFAPTISFLSAALIATQTAYRGTVVGIGDSLIAALCVAVLSLLTGGGPVQTLSGCLALALGLAVGALAGRLRRFTLCVQMILLFAYLVVLMYSLFGSVDNAVFNATIAQMQDVLRIQGMAEADIAALTGRPERLIGFYAVSFLLDLMLILALSFWLVGLVRERDFFAEFAGLRLGYVLSVPGLVIVLAALAIDSAVLHNLLAVAACGFLLQALAVIHGWGRARQWHPVFLVPVYVFAVPFAVLLILAAVLGTN